MISPRDIRSLLHGMTQKELQASTGTIWGQDWEGQALEDLLAHPSSCSAKTTHHPLAEDILDIPKETTHSLKKTKPNPQKNPPKKPQEKTQQPTPSHTKNPKQKPPT